MKIFFAIFTILMMFWGIDFSGKTIRVEEAWARASQPDATRAEVYFTVSNKGDATDTLLNVSTNAAASARLEETLADNGDAHMPDPVLPAGASVVPDKNLLLLGAGQSKTLRPHGTHIVLRGLKRPLLEGETFPLELKFLNKGNVEATVRIEQAGAMMYDGN